MDVKSSKHQELVQYLADLVLENCELSDEEEVEGLWHLCADLFNYAPTNVLRNLVQNLEEPLQLFESPPEKPKLTLIRGGKDEKSV